MVYLLHYDGDALRRTTRHPYTVIFLPYFTRPQTTGIPRTPACQSRWDSATSRWPPHDCRARSSDVTRRWRQLTAFSWKPREQRRYRKSLAVAGCLGQRRLARTKTRPVVGEGTGTAPPPALVSLTLAHLHGVGMSRVSDRERGWGGELRGGIMR